MSAVACQGGYKRAQEKEAPLLHGKDTRIKEEGKRARQRGEMLTMKKWEDSSQNYTAEALRTQRRKKMPECIEWQSKIRIPKSTM